MIDPFTAYDFWADDILAYNFMAYKLLLLPSNVGPLTPIHHTYDGPLTFQIRKSE